MQNRIYNEGRVQGYNAYEIYVRHLMTDFPDCEVPSEKEWLSSMLSNGLSMILKVKGGTLPGYHDYPLPLNSRLCAATSILAMPFDGLCKTDELDRWATCVTNYGVLSSNTSQLHPITPGDSDDTYPVQSGFDYYEVEKMLKDYCKITDGIIYQPGEWTNPDQTTSSGKDREPFMDYTPDLNKPGVVRLKIESQIAHDTYIMFFGFIDKVALRPVFSTETGVISTPRPEDGDFLGPAVFPWCTKISFIVSNEMLFMLDRPPIKKIVGVETEEKTLKSQPVIDMDTIDPSGYYQENFTDSGINLNVTYCSSSGDSVSYLSVYQREDVDSESLSGRNFPPVLYATKVNFAGQHRLVPIDVAAPGTMKLFDDIKLASNYSTILPNVYAIYRDEDNNLFFIDRASTESEVKMIDLSSSVRIQNAGTAEKPVYEAIIQSGKNVVKVPCRTDENGDPISDLYVSENVEFSGRTKQKNVTITGDNYITFGNGLRFYVSKTEPINDGKIPVGSIGIGW